MSPGKYFILSELLSHNVTLFYHVVINNLEALAPIIYTPVVGEVGALLDSEQRCCLRLTCRSQLDVPASACKFIHVM